MSSRKHVALISSLKLIDPDDNPMERVPRGSLHCLTALSRRSSRSLTAFSGPKDRPDFAAALCSRSTSMLIQAQRSSAALWIVVSSRVQRNFSQKVCSLILLCYDRWEDVIWKNQMLQRKPSVVSEEGE